MSQKTPLVKWKEFEGLEYLLISFPTNPFYVSASTPAHRGEAMAEVALRTSTYLANKALMHGLWQSILGMKQLVGGAVNRYGGALIVGRIWMSEVVNPDVGVPHMLFKTAWIGDAAASYDVLVRQAEEDAKRGAVMRPLKFPRPAPQTPPNGLVEAHVRIWARAKAKPKPKSARRP